MNQSLNLIPAATQRRYALRRVSRVWLIWIAASAAGAGLFLGVEWLRGLGALRELMELDARYAPFMRLTEEREVLAARIAELRKREENALHLSQEDSGLMLLGALSKAAANSGGDVYLDNLTFRRSTSSESGAVAGAVQLSGVGLDGLSVAEFATRLRESGAFDEVTVQNTQPIGGAAASLRQFSIAGSL